ncbi:MAG TPA: Cof-type HAD-IIB family hydrolase [Symbiobacteriaceae bacterium]|nr:Cof-type HAD-IIB family hydrolase [Symbiobacteriaceae bacterium]
MIKLVALDIDGTLVGKDHQIPPRTREAIRTAGDRGVRFAIVTGRMYKSCVPYARELGLEGMPLVAYNGGMVCEYPSGRLIYHAPVPLDVCKAMAAFCEARGYHLQAYVGDELYVPNMGPYTREYAANAGVAAHDVGPLSAWLQKPSTKLLIIHDAQEMPRVRAEVLALLGPAVEAASSHPHYLECVSPGVSKGTALEAIAASLGLERAEVMAVGDGMNDMDMLQWAGTSFAMAHAPEPLRRVATHVTESGPGDGVAEALERMGLA